jgi:predicted DNA-binding protein YlxM (UPF0122 family)
VPGGRPRKIPPAELIGDRDAKIDSLLDDGVSIHAIAKHLGVSRPTVYAAKARHEAAMAEISSKVSISKTRLHDPECVKANYEGFRDQDFTHDVPCCTSCALPREYPRHRSDGPYLPFCFFRVA